MTPVPYRRREIIWGWMETGSTKPLLHGYRLVMVLNPLGELGSRFLPVSASPLTLGLFQNGDYAGCAPHWHHSAERSNVLTVTRYIFFGNFGSANNIC